MIYKQKIIHFLEQASEKLKLSYQSALHSIQIVNIIETIGKEQVNSFLNHKWIKCKCFAASVLMLSCKLFQSKIIKIKQFVKLIDPKYRHLAVEELDGKVNEQKILEENIQYDDIAQLLKEFEQKIMIWLKWKFAIPLLYDETINIACLWDKYITKHNQINLKFESEITGEFQKQFAENHNYLACQIKFYLYHFSHLIQSVDFESLSNKIKKISISIFIVTLRKIIKNKKQDAQLRLNYKFSINYFIEDFLKKQLNLILENISVELKQVSKIINLENYARKENKKSQKIAPKASEEKQNYNYYIHKKNKSKSKDKNKNKKNGITYTTKLNQLFKSKSGSKSKSQSKICKNQKSRSKQKTNKMTKISEPLIPRPKNSIKSIKVPYFNENIKQKQNNQKKSKVIKLTKSNLTKRSQKSHLNSKIFPNRDNQFGSKSTHWLKSSVCRPQKSTNSSIRLKMR